MKMVPKMETFIQQPTAFKNILRAGHLSGLYSALILLIARR